ncbi:MAG: ribosome maturation factor RimM [Acidobacteria bacterium]|nr:ribosome maturation factor RimM [Acidobacteriota bacterium]
MAAAGWDSLVVVARVARPHGLRGEVVLFSETDFPEERFRRGGHVLVEDGGGVRTLTVRSARFYKGRPIVGFEGIDSIEAVETLVGHELRIEPGDMVALPPGCFYHHDLVGCRVETVEGNEVGTVTRVDGAGGASRLTVEGPAGEQLVPLVDAICRQIDPEARRIVIAPPEGLLDLNRVRGHRRARRGGRT